jgi:integrase
MLKRHYARDERAYVEPQMHLTDLSLRTLKAPERGQITYVDDTLPGFGVRVSREGVKSFVLVHGRSRTRVTLGRYPLLSLSQARGTAKKILAERTLGRHAPQTTTFETALTQYLAVAEKKNKASTFYSKKRLLDVHFLPRFRHHKLTEITAADIARKLDDLSDTPSEARHAYVALHTFFRWCERRHYVDSSPCNRMEAPRHHVSRARVLTDGELKIVASKAILGATAFHKIATLLLLTGQRRGQIAALRGEWIDRTSRTILFPPAVMKSNREHQVPYGPKAAAILHELPETGLLFPAEGTDKPFNAFSKPKIAFDKECGATGWTLHDLRRTMRTALARLKVAPHVAERILDHRLGTEVEAIYDRYLYLDEMREAIERWEEHIAALLSE